MLVLLLLLLLLLILCLGGLSYYIWGRKKDTANPAPSVTSTAPIVVPPPNPSPTDTGSANPSPSDTGNPAPSVSATPPVPATIKMPDLNGLTVDQATQKLKAAGFTKDPSVVSGDSGVPYTTDDGSWRVSGQNPKAGSDVPADTDIVITVTQAHSGSGNG
jgi:PASTA domain